MIKKLWVKFDEMDVECVCEHKNKKCTEDSGCGEYVVKFTPIDRVERNSISFSPKHLADRRRKLTTELNKATKHIKDITKNIK